MMRRFHVHIGVPDLSASIRFYSALFGAPPSVEKPDYAKWMLDDPRVNFAISHRATRPGLNHLGLQADSPQELDAIRQQFAAADPANVVDEPQVNCCYAFGDKHWTKDPQGIAWEAFHTLSNVPVVDEARPVGAASGCGTAASTCCGPGEPSKAEPGQKRSACCA